MPNPQKENGFTPIANEIMDALIKIKLSDGERKILFTVIRKTYGWNKKEDKISLTQFQTATGLPRSNVCRSIKSLVARMILGSACNGTRESTKYWFTKHYEKWLPSPITATSRQNRTRTSPISVKKVVPRIGHTKDNIQKTSKESESDFLTTLKKTY